MKKIDLNESSPRRKFLQTIAASTAVLGAASILSPFQQLNAAPTDYFSGEDADQWFGKKTKGKHKIVFDVTAPHSIFPFAWPKVFLLTNAATGTPEKDSSVVVILRHDAVGFALADNQWAKYNLGDHFKVDDQRTGKRSTRNPFWKPNPGEFQVPGIGPVPIGINELQDSGVSFCVCDMALTVNSAVVAQGMKMDAAEVKKEWLNNILPGVQVVPSGVWAVGRAQEHGCAYCFVS